MEKVTSISKGLMNWIIDTLNSGVKPEAIVDAMIRKGYDVKLAYTTLFRIIENGSLSNLASGENVNEDELPTISQKGCTIHTSDREINVLMKLDKPFVTYLDNVLSLEECDQLIKYSENHLRPSEVIDHKTGERKLSTGRTSKGAYFQLNESALIAKIEKRIAEITDYPVENGEGLQVLHYEVGEEYKAHFDYFPVNKVDHQNGGQRVGTFLLYLNDVEAGGNTIFPKINLSITPKKGAAVYFHYANNKGEMDRLSLHSSIPVTKGEKWVATKWIRQGEIGQR